MGHLNVLKGVYPSLSQLDETLPVAADQAIERGSAVVKTANGTWRLSDQTTEVDGGATGTPGPIVYFALQDANDPDVNMAKGLTAMPCTMSCEIETDQYATAEDADPDPIVVTPEVGKYIRVTDAGKVCLLDTTGQTAIGLCTKAPTMRWSNNDGPNAGYPGERTGGRISVIAFWTCYLPEVTAL